MFGKSGNSGVNKNAQIMKFTSEDTPTLLKSETSANFLPLISSPK